MLLHFLDRRFEILRHFIDRTTNTRKMIGIVLKVPEHFGEILGPYLQLRSILNGDSQHFSSDDIRERLSEISNYVHSPSGSNIIDEPLHYIADVSAEDFYTLRGKGVGGQAADPRVRGRIQEQHLLYHHLCNRSKITQANFREIFRSRCSIRRKVMQDSDYILVARHHPGMKKRIPVNRSFRPQLLEEWIRIGKDFRF